MTAACRAPARASSARRRDRAPARERRAQERNSSRCSANKAYRELSALAKRAGAKRAAGGPRVYVLPGLMGSRLGTRGVLLDDVLWVDIIEIAAGHLTRLALPGGRRLVALGAILLNALKLKLSLKIAGFDAHLHAYDWRSSIGVLAAELNARIAVGGRPARSAAGRPQHGRRRGARRARSSVAATASRASCNLARRTTARSHRCSPCAACIPRCASSRLSIAATRPRTWRASYFARCPRCTNCCPIRASRAAPTCSSRSSGRAMHCVRMQALLQAAAKEQAGWPAAHADVLHIAGVRQDTVTSVKLREHSFDFGVSRAGRWHRAAGLGRTAGRAGLVRR